MNKKAFYNFSIGATMALLALFVVAGNAHAQSAGVGNLGLEYQANIGLGTRDLRDTVATIINVAFGLLGTVAVVLILYGGFLYMTSAGEREKVDKARKLMINAAIGLAIILASYAIAYFIVNQLLKATGGVGGLLGGERPGSKTCAELYGADSPRCKSKPPTPKPSSVCADPGPMTNPNAPFICLIDPDSTTPGSFITIAGGEFGADKGTSNVYFVSKNLIDSDPVAGTGKPITPFVPSPSRCTGIAPNDDCFVAEIPTCGTAPAWADTEITAGVPKEINQALDTYYVVVEKVTTDSGGVSTSTYSYDKDARPKNSQGIHQGDFKSKFTLEAGTPRPSIACILPNNGPIGEPVDIYGKNFGGTQGSSSIIFYKNNAASLRTGTSWSDIALNTSVPGNSYGRNKYVKVNAPAISPLPSNGKLFTVTCNADYPCSEGSICVYDADGNGVCSAPPGGDGASCDAELTNSCVADQSLCQVGFKCGEIDCLCSSNPTILDVQPKDGAPGNFVTIFGKSFESYLAANSKVIFLGDPATAADDKEAALPSACGPAESSWHDDQIVVEIPVGAVDGPIKVIAGSAKEDLTNDALGPAIDNFDVNTVVKPGLCTVLNASATSVYSATDKGVYGDPVTVSGVNFSAAKQLAGWSFEEGKDFDVRDSIDGNHGKLTTLNSTNVWTTDGKFGKAITLNGSDEYMSVTQPASALDFNDPNGKLISISVWVKAAFPLPVREQIVDRGEIAVSGWGLGIIRNAAGNGELRFGNHGGQYAETVSAPISDSNWHHIVVVGGTADAPKIYVDKVLQSGLVNNGGWPKNSIPAADPVTVGRDSHDSLNFYKGTLDELKIYDGALTAADVEQLYDNAPAATQVFFSGATLANQPQWSITSTTIQNAVIPNLEPKTFKAQVQVGSQISNPVNFTVRSPAKIPILTNLDRIVGPRGQYVSLYGKNFGDQPGKLVFDPATGDTININAAAAGNPLFAFPPQCSDNGYWTDTSILFKIPETGNLGVNNNPVTISVIDADSNRNDAANDQTFTVCDSATNTSCVKSPSICKILPKQGPQRMSAVRIFGEGLGNFKVCNPPVSTTLTAPVALTDTTLTLQDATGFAAPGKVLIGNDEISFTTNAGGILGGVAGISATHASGDAVQLVDFCSAVVFFQTKVAALVQSLWSSTIIGPQTTVTPIPASVPIDENTSIKIPDGASSGPVQVESENGLSNTLQFNVADCRQDANICTASESCCNIGSLSGSCLSTVGGTASDMATQCKAAVAPVSNLHYDFTTGQAKPRPGVPMVKQDSSCTAGLQSPSPFMNSNNNCLNAVISATFVDSAGALVPMEAANFNDQNIQVFKCATTAESPDETFNLAGCQIGTANEVKVPSKAITNVAGVGGTVGFQYVPCTARDGSGNCTSNFDLNTWYYVRLISGPDAFRSVDGLWLDGNRNGVPEVSDDYAWAFKVGNDLKACRVDKVDVLPNEAELNLKDATQDYSASVMANNCNILDAASFDWAWQTKLQNGTSGTAIATITSAKEQPADVYVKPNQTATAVGQGLAFIEAQPKEKISGGAALSQKDGNNRLVVDLNIPLITSTYPPDGRINPDPSFQSYVTLNGTNFGDTQGNSKIFFDNVPASIAQCSGSWSDSRILVQVPKPKDIPADGSKVYNPGLRQSAMLASAQDSNGKLLYDFNDSSLALATDRLGAIDGSLNNVTKEEGTEGQAIRLHSTISATPAYSYVEIPADALKTANQGSIEFWFKLASLTGTQTLFAANDFTIVVSASGSIVISKAGIDTAAHITAGNWYHLVYSSTGTGGRGILYLNGTEIVPNTAPDGATIPFFFSDLTAPLNFVYFGVQNNGSFANPMDGWLDNVAIYRQPLTHQMVAENFGIDPAAGGLVALYDFEDQGVNFKNKTPNPLTVTSTSFPKTEPDAPRGYFGKAPLFTGNVSEGGTNNYIQLNDSPELVFDRGISIAAWFKAGAADVAALRDIFIGGGIHFTIGPNPACGGGTNNTLCFLLRIDNGSTIGFKYVNLGAGTLVSKGFKDNEWNLLAGTFDGRFMRLYINGQEANSFDLGLGTSNVQVASSSEKTGCIGAFRDSAGGVISCAAPFLKGQLDTFALYNRPIAAATLASWYGVGPVSHISVTTTGGESNKDKIFTQSENIYPFICQLQPNFGPQGSSLSLIGNNFGSSNSNTISTEKYNNGSFASYFLGWVENVAPGLEHVLPDDQISGWSNLLSTLKNPVGDVEDSVVPFKIRINPLSDPFIDANHNGDYDSGETYYSISGNQKLTTPDSVRHPYSIPGVTNPVPYLQSNDGLFYPAPVITSISPDNGPLKQWVTIKGYNFGDNPGHVFFTSSKVKVQANLAGCVAAWTNTQIIVEVPDAIVTDGPAITGPVYIEKIIGGSTIPSNKVQFKVNTNPLGAGLCGINPNSITAPYPLVALSGVRFGTSQGTSEVRINGTTVLGATAAGTWSDFSASITPNSTITRGGPVTLIKKVPSGNVCAGFHIGGFCPGGTVQTFTDAPSNSVDLTIGLGTGDGGTGGTGTCSDGIKNQNETGVDLGGVCGGGSSCVSDSQCNACGTGTSSCVGGYCTPVISDILPKVGSTPTAPVGAYVTLRGCYFCTDYPCTEGEVWFDGAAGTADDKQALPTDRNICGSTWSNTEVVIEVPKFQDPNDPTDDAVDGPVRFIRSDGSATKTNPDAASDPTIYSRPINDFNVDPTSSRPYICSLNPNVGDPGSVTSVNGKGFGATRTAGTDYVTFKGSTSGLTAGADDAQVVAYTDCPAQPVATATASSAPNGNLLLTASVPGAAANGIALIIDTTDDAAADNVAIVATSASATATIKLTDPLTVKWSDLAAGLNAAAGFKDAVTASIPAADDFIQLTDRQTMTLAGGLDAVPAMPWSDNHICVKVPETAKTGPVEVMNDGTESDNGLNYKVNLLTSGPQLISSTPNNFQENYCANGIISMQFDQPLDPATVQNNITLLRCENTLADSGQTMLYRAFAYIQELFTHESLAQVTDEAIDCKSIHDVDTKVYSVSLASGPGTRVVLTPRLNLRPHALYKVVIGDDLAGKNGIKIDMKKSEGGAILLAGNRQVSLLGYTGIDANTGTATVALNSVAINQILKRDCGEYMLVKNVSSSAVDTLTLQRNYYGSACAGDPAADEVVRLSNDFTFMSKGVAGATPSEPPVNLGLCQLDDFDITVYRSQDETGALAGKDFFLCSGENCKLPFDYDQAPGPSSANPNYSGNQHRYVALGKAADEAAASFEDKFERTQVNQGDNSFIMSGTSCDSAPAINNGQLSMAASNCELQFAKVCPVTDKAGAGSGVVSTGDVLSKDCGGFASGHVFACDNNEDGALCGLTLRDGKEFLIPQRYRTTAPTTFTGELHNNQPRTGFLIGGNIVMRNNTGSANVYTITFPPSSGRAPAISAPLPGVFPAFSKFVITLIDGVMTVTVDGNKVLEASGVQSNGIFGLHEENAAGAVWDNIDLKVMNFNAIKATYTWSRTDAIDPGRLVTLLPNTTPDSDLLPGDADRVQNETGEVFSQVKPVKTGETRIVIEGRTDGLEAAIANVVSKNFPINIFICENPWPNFDTNFTNTAYNFLTRYCRDIGNAKDPNANLPSATVIERCDFASTVNTCEFGTCTSQNICVQSCVYPTNTCGGGKTCQSDNVCR